MSIKTNSKGYDCAPAKTHFVALFTAEKTERFDRHSEQPIMKAANIISNNNIHLYTSVHGRM